MKLSTKQIILNYLQERNCWVPLWDLVKVNTKWGWLGTSARSRVQELDQEKRIEHKLGSAGDPMIEGKFSWYRSFPIEYETRYIKDCFGRTYDTIKIPKKDNKVQDKLL